MGIKLQLVENKIHMVPFPKLVDGDMYRLAQVPTKKAIAGGSGVNMQITHWEVPPIDFSAPVAAFPETSIFYDESIIKLKEVYDRKLIAIDKLPPESFDLSQYTDALARDGIVLDDYQVAYPNINAEKRRTMLTYGTGLGKTFGALLRAGVLGFKRILVCTIWASRFSWKASFEKMFDYSPPIYQGADRKKMRDHLPDFDHLICTYESLAEIPKNLHFDAYIFDESHLFCNKESNRYAIVNYWINRSRTASNSCQLLTATPMGNTVSTLWANLFALEPLIVGSYDTFCLRFQEPVGEKEVSALVKTSSGNYYRTKITKPKYFAINNSYELRTIMKALTVYKDENEVFKFEDVQQPEFVYLDEYERSKYTEAEKELRITLKDRRISIKEARAKILRLLQICEGMHNFEEYEQGAKLEWLIRYLKQQKALGKKVIVWSVFKEITNILGRIFAEDGVVYNGSIPPKKKDLAKWAFGGLESPNEIEEYSKLAAKFGYKHKPGEASYFFGVMDERSAAGMNLQAADIQVIASVPMSIKDFIQAIGRIRRRNQKSDKVTTIILLANATVEPVYYKALLKKYTSAKSVVGGKKAVDNDIITEVLDYLRQQKY